MINNFTFYFLQLFQIPPPVSPFFPFLPGKERGQHVLYFNVLIFWWGIKIISWKSFFIHLYKIMVYYRGVCFFSNFSLRNRGEGWAYISFSTRQMNINFFVLEVVTRTHSNVIECLFPSEFIGREGRAHKTYWQLKVRFQ